MGRAYGRVRDIINDRGQRIDVAVPSMPVAISGLGEVPDAGDKFYAVKSLKEAEAAAEERRAAERQRELATEKVTLANIFQKLSETGRKELPLIVKADVQGSVDALRGTLEKISSTDVTVVIKHAGVGAINDSDILLAETTGAIVVGFNVTSPASARKAADARGVDIRLYDVIYDVLDDVKKAAEGLLEPEYKLEVLGHADVRQVFKISRVGMVAGCYVTSGVIERNAQIRVTRDGIVVEKDRRLEQLKHFKDDAREVRAGQECGMLIAGYDDIRVGDVLECYKTLEVRRSL
jgi:translation initiation factor IF-2